MQTLKIIALIVVSVFAVTVTSLGIARAQDNEPKKSQVSELTVKVARILGLDVQEVENAISQAREELRNEAARKNLDALVEKGRLTQDQADEYLDWIQARPEIMPEIGNNHFGRMRLHKGGKRQGHLLNHRNHVKGSNPWGKVQEKLQAMDDRERKYNKRDPS